MKEKTKSETNILHCGSFEIIVLTTLDGSGIKGFHLQCTLEGEGEGGKTRERGRDINLFEYLSVVTKINRLEYGFDSLEKGVP